MEGIIVRSEEELADLIETLVTGVSAGLNASVQRGVAARMATAITINGTLISELSAATVKTSSNRPETVSISSETRPEVKSKSIRTTPEIVAIEETLPTARSETSNTTSSETGRTDHGWLEFRLFL